MELAVDAGGRTCTVTVGRRGAVDVTLVVVVGWVAVDWEAILLMLLKCLLLLGLTCAERLLAK